MNETAKAIKRRLAEDDKGTFPWRRIFSGRGLDVGCGPDKLPFDECEGFDLDDGDANHLANYFEKKAFNYIHASQLVEHLTDPAASIEEWLGLLRPHGHIIVTVPDWCLYEHMIWPSQYNPDHKSTWSMWLKGSPAPIHCLLPDWLKQFDAQILRCELIDTNYDYHKPFSIDQTWPEKDGVEAFIEFVLQIKRSRGRPKKLSPVPVLADPNTKTDYGGCSLSVGEARESTERPDAIQNSRGGGNIFLHSGDLGDLIAALPVMRQLGGGKLITTDHHVEGQRPRGRMKDRTHLIKGLLERQDYISSVEYQEQPTGCTHDFTTFRTRTPYHDSLSLAHWQGRHMEINELDLDVSPWLQVTAGTHDRVIAARSLRYNNPEFPWGRIAMKYGKQLIFVGLEEEHKAFEEMFGQKVTYQPTKDLLELAMLIKGAPLGFYNQSCPCWIALGLGTKVVQESYVRQPNSMIIRDNTYYTADDYGMWSVIAGLEQS